MRIIKPKFEILEQGPGKDGILQQIKTAGQTCYDSESKRTPEEFTEMLIKSGHGAMLEHGTVYLYYITKWTGDNFVEKYKTNKFSKVKTKDLPESDPHYKGDDGWVQSQFFITTNYRVLVENDWLDDLKYLYNGSDVLYTFEPRLTIRFTTQIAISREYNRHRVNSIAEQSTRFCNYSKDKYNGQIAIAKPTWIDEIIGDHEDKVDVNLKELCKDIYLGEDVENNGWNALRYWLFGNLAAEYSYLNMLRLGRTAQEARTVLPLDTRTELVHTAFLSDWYHFFNLRAIGTTGKPHPDAKLLAEPLMKEFERLGFINETKSEV